MSYRIQQWDVNNEKLHGNWYEEATGNPQFTEGMFHSMHELDRAATLMPNDYDVVSKGIHTSVRFRYWKITIITPCIICTGIQEAAISVHSKWCTDESRRYPVAFKRLPWYGHFQGMLCHHQRSLFMMKDFKATESILGCSCDCIEVQLSFDHIYRYRLQYNKFIGLIL